jgi:hypothetical protein
MTRTMMSLPKQVIDRDDLAGLLLDLTAIVWAAGSPWQQERVVEALERRGIKYETKEVV